jgi:hypothetical protein
LFNQKLDHDLERGEKTLHTGERYLKAEWIFLERNPAEIIVSHRTIIRFVGEKQKGNTHIVEVAIGVLKSF